MNTFWSSRNKAHLGLRTLSSMLVIVSMLLLTMTLPGPVTVSAQPLEQTGWTLQWADEFSGSGQPSSTNWNYHVGNGFNPGLGGFDGWGNGEWEWYRPENCYQSGGNLVMRADYNSSPTTIAGRQWYQFSCRITSDTKRSIQYGAIEARISMPSKIGTWPAFWMMGDACDDTSVSSYNPSMSTYTVMATNWASCGEVDIMEHRNTESLVVQNLYWDTRTGLFPWAGDTIGNAPTTYNAGNVEAFHTYRFEWTSTQMRWYVDGNIAKTEDISASNKEEFQKPFHLILNLALAGAFPAAEPNQADFPLYMNVDYIRVYQAGGGGGGTPTPVPTPSGTGVTFYQHINYGGAASGAKGPGNYAVLPSDIPNDWMSSLRVPAGWTVQAYEHGNFGGAVCTFTADTAWVGSACNDKMSSFKITQGSTGSNQGVDNVSSNQARAWYKCSGTCSYVILHYVVPGQSQQNVNMTYNSNAGRWEYLITGITSGQVLQYQFTYNDGIQHDTAWFTWTKP